MNNVRIEICAEENQFQLWLLFLEWRKPYQRSQKLEENLSKPENAARKPKKKRLILISERIFDSQLSFSHDVDTDWFGVRWNSAGKYSIQYFYNIKRNTNEKDIVTKTLQLFTFLG